MKKIALLVFIMVFLSPGLIAQVSNVNIAGSYDGVFTLSGTPSEYKVEGSPYLTETWMYGTLELKKAIFGDAGDGNKSDAETRHIIEMIQKCDELIQKIADPEYKTVGLTLAREKYGSNSDSMEGNIEVIDKDFEELGSLVDKFEGDLLSYLTQIRANYQSELTQVNELKGLFRYNLYAQEFEMIYETDTFAIRAPLDVKSISLSNMRFIYGFYIDREFGNEYLGSSYFEVLNEGSCKLLFKHEVKIKDHSGPATYSWAGAESDSFVKIRQFYYQIADDMEVAELKKSKKFLRKIFADKYDAIEQYIKTENINVKDQKGLIQVFNFYNNLDS